MAATHDDRTIAHDQLEKLLEGADPHWSVILVVLGMDRRNRAGHHLATHLSVAPRLDLTGDVIDGLAASVRGGLVSTAQDRLS